jgi:hypothetical protein
VITLGYLVSFAAGLSWLYSSPRKIWSFARCAFNCACLSVELFLSRNLHRALPRTHHARILAQRPKFRSISKSESNRGSFRARRDRDSCLRSGRSSQAKKTVDRLDPGAGPDRDSDHFEFFALWSRDAHGGQRILAWHAGVQTAFSLATRAWNLSFSSSFATHGGAAFGGQTLERFHLHDFGVLTSLESPVANFS